MPTFLHIGCNRKYKDQTTLGFNTPEWTELRLDISPDVEADIVANMLDMKEVASESMDAIYSSHTLEHLYAHEVPIAIQEFLRVLKPEGFLVLACPDLQSVCALIAEDKLTSVVYESPSGPVTPLDILFGYTPFLARGNVFMAHHCGFTRNSLCATLRHYGFAGTISMRRFGPYFDLQTVATKSQMTDDDLKNLAQLHFFGEAAPTQTRQEP